MARHKVIHSDDACCILIEGNRASPEPSTAIIRFPGGRVEVSRTTDGAYWVHVSADGAANIVDSRIDYSHEEYRRRQQAREPSTPPIPSAEAVVHMALLMRPHVQRETGG